MSRRRRLDAQITALTRANARLDALYRQAARDRDQLNDALHTQARAHKADVRNLCEEIDQLRDHIAQLTAANTACQRALDDAMGYPPEAHRDIAAGAKWEDRREDKRREKSAADGVQGVVAP